MGGGWGAILKQSRGATACTCQSSGLVCLVSLEGDLQDAIAQPVAVETGNGHGRLVVIRHGDEAETFAFVGVEVSDHLDVVDGAKWTEELPQHTLVGIWGQVVHKNAPASSCVARDVHAHQTGHAVNGDGRKPVRGRVREQKGRENTACLIKHAKVLFPVHIQCTTAKPILLL